MPNWLVGNRSFVNGGSIFHNARLQPLANQTEDAAVTDPMFDETNQPVVTDRVEGSHDTLPIIRTFLSKSRSSALAIRSRASRSPYLDRHIGKGDCI